MKKLKRTIAAVTVAVLSVSSLPVSVNNVTAADVDQVISLRPDEASVFHDTDGDGLGEFEGWGTSLCWWANRVGYDETLTEKTAKLFFGDEGLDMNIGRYNVGGGDLTGDVPKVTANPKAVIYDLESEGQMPEYEGTSMSPNTNREFVNSQYVRPDADFGITQGDTVGEFKMIGWINALGAEVGKGGNLHYNIQAEEEADYTIKFLMVLGNENLNRNVGIRVNGKEYVVPAEEINGDVLAGGGNLSMYRVIFKNVAMNKGNNKLDIGGVKIKDSDEDWTLDFVKMAVIKSGEEGILDANQEFIHKPHLNRSDSGIPGYATDVTKIVITEERPLSWYQDNFVRADEECGYAWNYDWDADKNQVAVLKAAAKASGNDFIAEAFSNSPPYFMTNSGCSSGSVNPWKDNLRWNSYHAFAAYMADVIEHWNKEGVITFQSTTPTNEPYTPFWPVYSPKQEGCHFDQGDSESRILVELNKELKKKGIDIIISGTDETNIDTQIDSYHLLSDEAKNIISRIDTHTYDGSKRKELSALAEEEGKNLWMSEIDGTFMAGTNAGEMGAALGLSERIMLDINELKSSAWILWNAIDTHIDEKNADWSIVDYQDLEELKKNINLNEAYWGIAFADHNNKEIVLTKKYYAYGQFSKYIRPGYTIIASGKNTLAAYDPKGKKVVIVAMNTSAEDKTWKFDLGEFQSVGNKITAIRTSGSLADGENWADVTKKAGIKADGENKSFEASMKANSITTFIVEDVTYEPEGTEEKILADFDFDTDGEYFDGGNARATGEYELVEHGDGKALKLNGNGQHLIVTDKDGKSLLTGVKEMTVSYQIKPENSATNWGFFAAPDANEQVYQQEHYLGIVDINGITNVERYDNTNGRPASIKYATGYDGWYHVTVVYTKGATTLYIDGKKVAEEASVHALRDILGNNSVLYIGKSTWKEGEYATALIDNYKIVNKAFTEEEVAAEVQKYADEKPPVPVTLPYVDVAKGEWYYNAVEYNYIAKTMTGKNETHFAPAETLVRAQFAAVLHKMNAQPEVTYTGKFSDVTEPDWFKNAVLWAADKKVVTGYTGTTLFGPNDNVTREQMATMMYRYAKDYKEYQVTSGDYSTFPDAEGVQEFAREAMKWAVGNGIITGKTINGVLLLDPQGSANRAECATIIQRFMEKYEK